MTDILARPFFSARPLAWKAFLLTAVIAAFFPWVSFNLNAMDTQPWFIILAGAYLVLTMTSLLRGYVTIWLFIGLSAAVLLLLHENEPFHTLRGISTYVAAGFAVLVFARYMQVDIRTRMRLLVLVNMCWLVYPLFQLTGLSELFPLVSGRTSDSRGFTSLAAEPTFYGVFCLTMIAIVWLEREQWERAIGPAPPRFRRLIWLNVFQIIFVAWSSMGILLMLFALAVAVLVYRPKHALTLALLAIFTAEFALELLPASLLEGSSRPIHLLKLVLDDPSVVLVIDESINARFTAIYVSITEAFKDFLVPHGLYSYGAASQEYERLSPLVNSYQGNIIMSFAGAFLYELGIISLLYFYVLARALNNRPNLRSKVYWAIVVSGVLVTAVPVGFPMVGYVIALLDAGRVRPTLQVQPVQQALA